MTVIIEPGQSAKRRTRKKQPAPVGPQPFRPGPEWFLAGDAIFTVQVPADLQAKCGLRERYTFRIQKTEPSERWPNPAWFVKLLTGPQNTDDYSYLGKLDDFAGQVRHTAKSCVGADSPVLRLLNRVLLRAWGGEHRAYEDHGVVINHAGSCARCGRLLTVPESVASGFGPECIKLVGGGKEKASESFELSDRPGTDVSKLTAHRDAEGDVTHWTGQLNGRNVTVFND